MIGFLFFLVSLLVGSQIYLFHLYTNNIKRYDNIKKGSIILEPKPKEIEVEDVEGCEELLNDILLSAKEENWICEFITGHWSDDGYHMKISSPDGNIMVEAIIRTWDSKDIRLLRFIISTSNISRFNISGDKFKNKILVFLWDFVLDKHIKENSYKYEEFKKSITEIKKNLKSLNRNRILDELLNK